MIIPIVVIAMVTAVGPSLIIPIPMVMLIPITMPMSMAVVMVR
jgi:hypothetical protein